MSTIEKIFYPTFLIVFALAMTNLFLAFADYVGKNGIEPREVYNAAHDEVMSLVVGEGNL